MTYKRVCSGKCGGDLPPSPTHRDKDLDSKLFNYTRGMSPTFCKQHEPSSLPILKAISLDCFDGGFLEQRFAVCT